MNLSVMNQTERLEDFCEAHLTAPGKSIFYAANVSIGLLGIISYVSATPTNCIEISIYDSIISELADRGYIQETFE